MRGYPDHLFDGQRLLFGSLSFLLLLAIAGLLIYLIVLLRSDRSGAGRAAAPPAPEPGAAPGLLTPIEVVKMRYARGEITREEYETMRRDLT